MQQIQGEVLCHVLFGRCDYMVMGLAGLKKSVNLPVNLSCIFYN